MAKKNLQIGAILGALAVILGAFAAHGLKEILDSNQLNIFQTGVRYQFYHTFTLLVAGWFGLKYKFRWFQYASTSFIIGMVCFSGSLYLMACRFKLGIESLEKLLGPITPIGGLFFIAGWILLLIGFSKIKIDA